MQSGLGGDHLDNKHLLAQQAAIENDTASKTYKAYIENSFFYGPGRAGAFSPP